MILRFPLVPLLWLPSALAIGLNDTWLALNVTKGDDVALSRAAHSSVVFNQSMIVFGGYNFENLNDLWRLDSDLSWRSVEQSREPRPGPREGHSAVVADGVMWVFGGAISDVNTTENRIDELWRYHVNESEWSEVTEPHDVWPVPRSSHCAVAHPSGVMVVFGGYSDDGGDLGDTWTFAFNASRWRQMSAVNAPPARNQHSCVANDRYMIVFGGWAAATIPPFSTFFGDVYKYDVLADQWLAISPTGPVPAGRHGHTALVLNGLMLVYGGTNTTYYIAIDELLRFDLASDAWLSPGALCGLGLKPPPLYRHTAVAFGSATMLLFGGMTDSGPTTAGVWAYVINASDTDGNCSVPPPSIIVTDAAPSSRDAGDDQSQFTVVTISAALGGSALFVLAGLLVLTFAVRRRRRRLAEKKAETEAAAVIATLSRTPSGPRHGVNTIYSDMAGSEESTVAAPPPGGAWKATTPSASVLIDEFYRVRDITVQERLGGGSFGDVFRGLWNGSTLVALKQLKDSEQLKDFFREARMLKSLQHPNIVQFFGIFALNDQMYIVTEFMHKGSLETLLRRNRHLTPVELLGLARQAAAGMQYLEMANVVHRDLALRNLLVTAQGPDLYLVKIADFGLSRNVASDYYRASDMKIPIRWSAPEVLQYGIWTSKSDVFSMGVVLWEMFSFGSIPWPSKSNNDVLMLVLDGERMVPPKDCPVEVQEIMLLCWAQSPDDRPSFTELFKLIQQLLAEADASEPALDALNWTTPSASAESEHSRGPPSATDATAFGADQTASIALYNNA